MEMKHSEDLGEDGRKLLKWIFRKWDKQSWTRVLWLRTGAVDGRLWM